MTELNPNDEAIFAEVNLCLHALDDAHVRRRIVHAWQDYKIDGDKAMMMLIGLDLIEHIADE